MIFDTVTNKLFKNLIDGTTPAGNALKLNGKEAIEYALKRYSFMDYLDYGSKYFKSTDLNDWIKSGAYGVSSSCTNVPPNVTAWGTLLVVASSTSKIIQIFKPWNYSGLYWRFGSNGTWGDWEKFNENAAFLKFTHQNEINFKGNAEQTRQWFNYRNADTDETDATAPITEYCFGNKNGSTKGVTLIADYFSGSAKKIGDYGADDFKKASYQIYEGDILAITKDGTYCCSKYDCTNFPPQISSWAYITKVGFRDSGYKKFFATPLNSNTNANLSNIYVAHESVKDSNGNMIWKSITEDFFHITGGKLTGNIEVTSATAKVTVDSTSNPHPIALESSNAGNAGLYDYLLKKWIIKSDKDGKVTIDGNNTPLHTGNSLKVQASNSNTAPDDDAVWLVTS